MAAFGNDLFSGSGQVDGNSISVERTEGQVRILISGEFTFKIRQAFRAAYCNESTKTRYVVDLAKVNVMDSSAMGMLLVLREHAGGDGADVTLTNISPRLTTLLKLASLHEMFKFV